MNFKMKMRTKLITIFVFFVSVPILVVGSVAIHTTRQSISDSIREERTAMAKQAAYELNRYISDVRDILSVMTSLPETADFQNPSSQKELLDKFKQPLVNIDYFYIVNKNGVVVNAVPHTNFGGDIDWSEKPWFKQVSKEKKPYLPLSSIISDANNQPVVFLVYPILGPGAEFEGVLGANISLVKISEYLSKMKFEETGEVFVIDKEGYTIIHPSVDRVLKREKNPELINKLEVDKLIKYKGLDGKERLVTGYPIEGTGWMVCVSQDITEAYFSLYQLLGGLVLLAVMVIIAAYITAVYVSGRIVQPIKDITVISENLAYGYPVKPVQVFADDEIGKLAKTFNFMADSISQRDKALRVALFRTSELSVNLLELKDSYTAGHSKYVEALATKIAKIYGMSDRDLETLKIAAILHDIGKIGIRGDILNKPGPLTEEEYQLIKTHPLKGAEALQGLEGFEEVRKIIMHHHERYDGTGYPNGLKGEEIPIGSRIISVVDAFDAMNSNRSYRMALPLTIIREIFCKEKGRQFDPHILEMFYQVIGWHEDLTDHDGRNGYGLSEESAC